MKWGVMGGLSIIFTVTFYHLIMGILTAQKIEIEHQKKERRFTKILLFTEKSVNESNIKYYIKNYNSLVHFFLAIGFYVLCYHLVWRYPIEFRILLSIIAFQIPWVILQFVKVKTTAEIKRQILDLMISFKAYYILTKDIFQAFKLLEGNLAEPVNGIVAVLNKQYLITKREGERCLETFQKRFSELKMRMFIEQLMLAYRTGGDVESICTKFIDDMSKYEELEDKEKLDALSDRLGLYFMIAMNLVCMHYMMQHNYVFVRFVTYNIIGKLVLMIDYIICIYLLIKLIKEG
ncbi:MAG: hypothetical protein JXR88_03615 [Clostridia bacterium]|nr:hypothetical protein [Clostridia bacterium]